MFSKRPIRTLAPKDQIPKWVSGLLYFQQEGTRSGQCPLAMRYLLLNYPGFPPGNAVPADGNRNIGGQRPLAMRYLLLSHPGFPPGNAVT